MAKILDMPKLSPTMEEGVLSVWHKKEGDDVGIDDLLAEVETDKATMEFRSFDKGTILKILVPAGSNVKLGQPVAIVGTKGEDVSALAGGAAATAPAAAPPAAVSAEKAPSQTAAPTASPSPAQAKAEATPAAASAKPNATGAVSNGSLLDRTEREGAPAAKADGAVFASPYVRKLARERGIALEGATGSGTGGRVEPADLEKLGTSALAVTKSAGGLTVATSSALVAPVSKPLTMMRKTIARRLTESKQKVPHFYLTVDIDVTHLSSFREELNHELQSATKSPDDVPMKISVNDLLIKAVAVALTRVPECNAQFTEEALLFHQRVDISVAVAVPDGLVTPVIRDADKKSVTVIAKEVRDLAARARSKKLRPEEMQDGTFSISNLGMFGIDEFSAVINPPEGAILAVGRVRDEAIVHEGAVVAGKKMGLTLSCDHRVVDGAVGAAFLAELRALLERPLRVLLG